MELLKAAYLRTRICIEMIHGYIFVYDFYFSWYFEKQAWPTNCTCFCDFTEETTASEGINIALPGKAIFQGNRTISLGKLAFRNVSIWTHFYPLIHALCYLNLNKTSLEQIRKMLCLICCSQFGGGVALTERGQWLISQLDIATWKLNSH